MAAAKSGSCGQLAKQIGHTPLLIVIVSGNSPDCVCEPCCGGRLANQPARLQSAFDAILADSNPDCLVVGLEIDKLHPSPDAAAQPLELSGQDLLGDAFRQTQHERKWRVENLKPKRRPA